MGDKDLYIYLAVAIPFCFFTMPLYLCVATVLFGIALFYFLVKDKKQASLNPFRQDTRTPRRPYIHEQRKRDDVIKQPFHIDKVPKDLDAIVIGSGIGGLTTAAIMAKAGKKVLVLEQHDQAGGCCHTFIDKGYEFDIGIHYIGELSKDKVNRTLVDQITDGQLEWELLDEDYDVVSIGDGRNNKDIPVIIGEEKWKQKLKEIFPKEEKAIDEFFKMMTYTDGFDFLAGLLKLLPLKVSEFIVRFGLYRIFSGLWSEKFNRSMQEIVEDLTDDPYLRTVFCYCWGDAGTPPRSSHILIQALILRHFLHSGAYYPVGGASEIALSIIPVIEKPGGKVLVRANVQRILYDGSRVTGVRVRKGGEQCDITAPVVISSAGVYNTFQNLLPIDAAKKSYYTEIPKELKVGLGSISVFVGLNVSHDELKAKKQNIWAFSSPNSAFADFSKMTVDEFSKKEPPLMFLAFPSAKDPEWKNHPARQSKSTLTIVTLVPWDWFSKWENRPITKRGDDYEALKKTIGDNMVEYACRLYPQIRHHIDYVDVGTPVTNKHYIAQPHGEIYGLDHSAERFSPLNLAKLRPTTDIEGLYLTGQDVFACGFTGAMFGGVLAAGEVLGRNVMADLEHFHKKLNK